MPTCEFCDKQYSSVSNLNKHQKESKFCLDIQFQTNPDVIRDRFKCYKCDKILSSNRRLEYHISICKEEVKNHTEPVSITNVNSNNIINNNINIQINYPSLIDYLTPERMSEALSKIKDKDELLDCSKMFAKFAISSFLSGYGKPVYLCTDRERKSFTFFDNNNNKIEDGKLEILCGLLINNYIPAVSKPAVDSNCIFNKLVRITSADDFINCMAKNLPKTQIERNIRDKVLKDTEEMKCTELITEEPCSTAEIQKLTGLSEHDLNKNIRFYIKTGQFFTAGLTLVEENRSDIIKQYERYLKSKSDDVQVAESAKKLSDELSIMIHNATRY